MNNMGTLYRIELRKILCRRITVVVMIIVSLLMIAMNIGEYVAGSKVINKAEQALEGRAVNDELLDEMRAATDPKNVTMEDGTRMMIGVSVNDPAYQPLVDYLATIGGNYDKAYHMTESELEKRFRGVISEPMREQYLTAAEQDYWYEKLTDFSMPLTYGKIQNGWGDAVCIVYVVAILSMISIAATLSGVFSDEMQLRTDALIFSSRNGKRRLASAKLLAGITVGMLETLLILLVCVATQFTISGINGGDTSVQFFVGPTAMDMSIRRAFWIFAGIMMIIGLLLSIFAMCLSQICRNSVAVISVMMGLWLISMLTPPYSWRLVSQACGYLPVTFLGSWTFSDYRMVSIFGHLFTIFEAAPVLYVFLSLLLGLLTGVSYRRYQVTK
ncbi:MAG: ABC transporter permease subunit [Eubacteriales bacterium]|nr:ABC transporter permease subunit [Eubacteriales bacterium]